MTSIPPSHPLIAELGSLRQQLAAYQKASHQSGIQLQGVKLELSLAHDELERSRAEKEALSHEVQVLRNQPSPPSRPPQTTALAELSLAHRRLSAKLDLTEQQLAASQLELAGVRHEVQRLTREREGDRATINELRRVEEDREEEVEWERGERRKAQEQKKLCDLALQEYSSLVHSLDPSAVPPSTPSSSSTPSSFNFLSSPPSLTSPPSTTDTNTPSPTLPHTPSPHPQETISSLLVGQRGVHQLFQDFTTTLSTKERHSHALQRRVEALEQSLEILHSQLDAETATRVRAEEERDRALRDDASAARVVERYMTFTQKTHRTVHLHLEQLRARSAATRETLGGEIVGLREEVRRERTRARALRDGVGEMAEGLAREAAGRRREVALRLRMVAEEERWLRRGEGWADKVRQRKKEGKADGAGGDLLLLEEGVVIVLRQGRDGQDEVVLGKGGAGNGWKMFGKKRGGVIAGTEDGGKDQEREKQREREREESSVARVLLAEELVNTLVEDLQRETERRVELERQRVDWLEKEAVMGMPAARDADAIHDHEDEGHGHGVMFDVDADADDDHGEEHVKSLAPAPAPSSDLLGGDAFTGGPPVVAGLSPLPTPSPLDEEPPLLPQLTALFDPVLSRSTPLQKTLHDLSLSLVSLRSSLPSPSASPPTSPTSARLSPLRSLALRSATSSAASSSPLHDPALPALLDALHEVLEDARVDVEIALADDERVYRGFEALLGVRGSGSGGGGARVLGDAREYVDDRGRDGGEWTRLEKRVGEVESDLMSLKRGVHEAEGMDFSPADGDDEGGEVEGREKKEEADGWWTKLDLKTITARSRPAMRSSASPLEARRRTTSLFASVGSAGRSLSASVIRTPGKVGGLAGGLYRGVSFGRANGGRNGEGPEGREPEDEREGLLGAEAGHAQTDVDDVE